MREELESLAGMAEPGELGNMTRVAEEARAAWGWTWLEQLYRDVQYALRSLRHNPAFTASAVMSLALGIGANTAIFGLIDALMLRWLPVRNPQELVQLAMQSAKGPEHVWEGDSLSYAIVKAMDNQKDIFSHACGFTSWGLQVGPRGSVSRVDGAFVSGDYYATLGLAPALGRLLEPSDDQPGAPLVAVITYSYWQRQFAGNPGAIGQTIVVSNAPVTIAGVSPPGFEGTDVGWRADIMMPLASIAVVDPSAAGLLGPGNFWLRVLARPRTGISRAQAKARLAIVWPQIADQVSSPQWPPKRRKEMADSTFDLLPGATGYSSLRHQFSEPLLVLMAVAGLVFLIACANVASLLLARATARQREISVRLAIGAGRGRIIRQLLTESTLLSALGAAAGVWLAWITSRLLLDTLSQGQEVAFDLTPNWHILGFAIALALANGILFGLAPALRTTSIGRSAVLSESARTTNSGSRLLSSLVTGQVALSLLLVVGAGLFARTLQNLLNVDPGFRREGVLVAYLDGGHEGYSGAKLSQFYAQLLDGVRRVPGVVSAALTSHTPLSGATWSEAVVPKGQPLPDRDNAVFIAASPDFFRTMGTPVVSGRDFNEGDRGSGLVAIVNQSFVNRFFPGKNPVGEYLTASVSKPPSDLQIVGVVKDSMTASLRRPPGPTVYISYWQRQAQLDALVIRVAGSLSSAREAVHKELAPKFPITPIFVRPLSAQVENTLMEERLMAKLSGGFGVLGLLLACVGLYGLLAYGVVRRTKEIGVRMALGAQRGAVLWMVARRALGLVAAGIVVGLPLAWLAARKVQSMLFGLTPGDSGVLLAAVASLAAAGLVAAYFPARRASRVDPMTALRHE